MARTFRLRHLPRFSARRFIDARSHGRWYAAREAYEASLVAAGLTALQASDLSSWRLWGPIAPAVSLNAHPWARLRSGAVRTEYKRLANRWARRATRMEVRPRMDPEEPAGRRRREYFRRGWFL